MRLVVAGVAGGAMLAASAMASASPPTWTVQTSPSPSGFAVFNAVSCASKTNCVAVGSTSTAKAVAPLAEVWDGSSWKVAKVTDPLKASQSGTATLSGVSCPSTSSCVAVGSYTVGTSPTAPTHPFSEVWQNGAWALHKTAHIIVSGAALAAVSCVSAKSCVAVGDYDTKTLANPLSESWNGSSWTLIKSAAIASSNASFLGISCTSSTRCTAVGSETTNGLQQIVLAERLRGLTWHIQSTPHLSPAVTVDLASVSCPTATECVAVGGWFRKSFVVTLAEAWNGSTWKVVATPHLAGKGDAELTGVSCTSAKVCRAVGAPPAIGQASAGLAEAWNGSSWKVQSVADPSPTTSLAAVSCTSGPHCTAAGDYNPSPTKTHPLAERN
jgi:hypothetical protein